MRSWESFFQMVTGSEKMEIPDEFVSRVGGPDWILVDENRKLCRVEVLREGNCYCLCRGWSEFYRHNSLKQGDVLMFRHQSQNEFGFKVFCERGQVVKVEEENEDGVDDDIDKDEEVEGVSKKKYNRRNAHDHYGEDIFKSGFATKPKNPYFISHSRTKARKHELYIPNEVIENYHLKLPEELLLVDEEGRKWEANVNQWKDGRVWCTKWRKLCSANNIGFDDVCICEFVRGWDGMCIHVSRVGTV